jgi:hypothetical protein
MKKFLLLGIPTFVLFLFTACSSTKPGEFIVTEQYVNEKLSSTGFQVSAEQLTRPNGGTIETETVLTCSLKSKSDSYSDFGSVFFEYKEGFCNQISLVTYGNYKGLKNTEKAIDFICDLYGSESKSIIKKVKDNFKTGENLDTSNKYHVSTAFWEKGLHYEISFNTEIEGDYSIENLTLTSMVITEENKFNADRERSRQALLKLIDANPLLYTYGEPGWPQWKTVDEINSILKDNSLPYSAEFGYFSKTEAGTANTAYTVYNSKGEKAGDISVVRFASGYEYSVLQNTVDGNGWIIRMSAEDILKTACEISGVKYTTELLNAVNEHMSNNVYSAYFEYDGLYFVPMYSTMYGNYKYLHGISVYEPDVLKGRLISWINNYKEIGLDYTKYQEIYDKYFG